MTISLKLPVNKEARAATLILSLLFSVLAAFQFVSLALANPYDGTPVPPSFQKPNKDPPIVTIQSPCSTAYLENEILLNFTVTQPDSWFEANVSCWIKKVTYQLDGQAVTLYEPTPSLHELPATKQFSTVLKGLTEGWHTLQVNVSAESQYCPHPTYYFFLLERYPLDVYQTVLFTVGAGPFPSPSPSPTPSPSQSPSPSPTSTLSPSLGPSPSPSASPTPSPSPSLFPAPQETEHQIEPQPFPTTLVATSSVLAAVIGVGLMMYFGRVRKGKAE
jgi:hypothetical protein